MRRRTFADYVSEKTIIQANFNYWEPSTSFGGYTAYVAYQPERCFNIVVIEGNEGRRKRWYFGMYNGPREISDEEMKQICGIVTRKNRIGGRNLERAILQVLDPG